MIQFHSYCWQGGRWVWVWDGGGVKGMGGSHQECTVIVSLIGPVISELCVGVCIIRSVNQSNKRCIYSDSSIWLPFSFVNHSYSLPPLNKPSFCDVEILQMTKMSCS